MKKSTKENIIFSFLGLIAGLLIVCMDVFYFSKPGAFNNTKAFLIEFLNGF